MPSIIDSVTQRRPIGRQLVAEGLIRLDQLESALATQRQFRGRLGTNLLELKYLEVDVLAQALGRQLGVPAALAEDFRTMDRSLAAKLPARAAKMYEAIPLGMALGRNKVARVALVDPQNLVTLDGLAAALGCRIEPLVAPESRIFHLLGRLYKIVPPRRTAISVMLDRPLIEQTPGLFGRPASPQRSLTPPEGLLAMAPTEPPAANHTAVASSLEAAIRAANGSGVPGSIEFDRTMLASPSRGVGHDERLALPRGSAQAGFPLPDVLEPMSLGPASSFSSLAEDDPLELLASLSDTELRARRLPPGAPQREEPTNGQRPAQAAALAAPRPAPDQVLAEVLQRLSHTTSRDEVAAAVVHYLSLALGGGLLFLIKGELALGWRGVAEVDSSIIESAMIPLGSPSVFQAAYEQGRVFRGPPLPQGSTLQERFWKLMRWPHPTEVLVAPVVLGSRVVNLIYAQTTSKQGFPEGIAGDLSQIALAAAQAYQRAIRARQS